MKHTLIAIATGEDGLVAPHAGRASHWQVFAVTADATAHTVWNLDLSDYGSLHEWHVKDGTDRHPLHLVDIAIAGSAGDGVIRRLAERQTELVTTTATDVQQALTSWLEGQLPAGLPHEEAHCLDPQKRQQRA